MCLFATVNRVVAQLTTKKKGIAFNSFDLSPCQASPTFQAGRAIKNNPHCM